MPAPILSREQILSAPGFKRKLVEVEGWGGAVWVRELSQEQRDRYTEAMTRAANGGAEVDDNEAIAVMAELVSELVIGEDWKPLLTREDAITLGQRSIGILQDLILASLTLSGPAQTIQAVAEAKKNLKNARSANSR